MFTSAGFDGINGTETYTAHKYIDWTWSYKVIGKAAKPSGNGGIVSEMIQKYFETSLNDMYFFD